MIAGALDSYLVATDEERKPDGFFHPSGLFSCDRLAVYEQRGFPRTDDKKPEEHRPLVMGKLIHELLQASVTHLADTEQITDVWHEVKVFIPTLGVKGSADSLVLFADGTYEVEEFKSTKSSGIKYAKGGFTPKEEHVKQGLTYVYGIRYFPWFTTHVGPDGKEFEVKHDGSHFYWTGPNNPGPNGRSFTWDRAALDCVQQNMLAVSSDWLLVKRDFS
mgnify:CR=1 FL=1